MATSSIFENIVIENDENCNSLIKTLEKLENSTQQDINLKSNIKTISKEEFFEFFRK